MSKQDRHLTTTQLSTLLDGQLSAQEQAQCDAHLKTCELCQQELAALRQTVALLHALPQPTLPRSFLLPVAGEHELQSVTEQRTNHVGRIHDFSEIRPATPIPLRRNVRPGYAQTPLRVVSTLVAVAGFIFILSGLWSAILPTNSILVSSSSGTSSSSGVSGPQAMPPTRVSEGATATGGAATPNSQTPAVKPAPSNTKHVTSPAPTPLQSFLSAFDLGTSTGRLLLGTILFVIGLIILLLARRQQTRAG